MYRWLSLALLFAVVIVVPAQAGGISGQYIEARTCDVWTGPCFANADMSLDGKHAVLAWKVDQGALDNVRLDGLAVVAIVSASDTLGLEQTGPAKSVLIVDSRASAAQRAALIGLAKRQAGDLVGKVVAIQNSKIEFEASTCTDGGCARLEAGKARIETRCLDGHHDKVCGNESAFYPPLSKDVKAQAAVAIEHSFAGTAFNETWKDSQRRGAYVGSFEIR
ncbi:MAG TPA: DUF1326 domain-containing protein [Gemmataceae bacterium]|nr:DUF1326 domain-containing protein [Gemmataceae bacterium]